MPSGSRRAYNRVRTRRGVPIRSGTDRARAPTTCGSPVRSRGHFFSQTLRAATRALLGELEFEKPQAIMKGYVSIMPLHAMRVVVRHLPPDPAMAAAMILGGWDAV